MASFFYEPLGGAFSILWPLTHCSYGDEVTRDYLPTITDQSKRSILLRAFGAPLSAPASSISKTKTPDWFNEWARIMSEKFTTNSSFSSGEFKIVYRGKM